MTHSVMPTVQHSFTKARSRSAINSSKFRHKMTPSASVLISLLLIAISVYLCSAGGQTIKKSSDGILRAIGNNLFEGVESVWSERQSDRLWLPVIPAKVSKFFPLLVVLSVLPVVIVPLLIVSWWVVTAPVSSP